MRAGTAFALTLVLLLGAGVGIDAWLTQQAEARASEQVAALLDAERADVRLGPWPASLRLLSGRVPDVEVAAVQARTPDGAVVLQNLEVHLRGVAVDFAALERGVTSLRGRGGSFVADVSADSVSAVAGASLRFGDGLGQVEANAAAVEVAASVEEGVVVLRPVGAAPEGAAPVALSLPRLPGGAVIEQARIVPGALRIAGVINHLGG